MSATIGVERSSAQPALQPLYSRAIQVSQDYFVSGHFHHIQSGVGVNELSSALWERNKMHTPN